MAVDAGQYRDGIAVDNRPGRYAVLQYIKPCHPGYLAGEESCGDSDAHWQGKEYVIYGTGMGSL